MFLHFRTRTIDNCSTLIRNTEVNMRNNFKNIIMILIGSFISSLGVNMFMTHAHLLSGGASGIALIIQYKYKIPAGYSLIVFNIPLLILSYYKLNRRFTYLTIIGTVSFSAFLVLTMPIKNILAINDTLLFCLYGGVLNGLGIGIVFSNHGSGGGINIISMIIKKKYDNFDLGQLSFYANMIIVAIGAAVFDVKSALYTLVSMYITAFVTDRVIHGFNRQKIILVVSQKDEEISTLIKKELHRGVTLLYGEGSFSKKEQKILYCAVQLHQLPRVKQLIKEIDKNAFISIIDASEVQGRGFMANIG